MNTPIFYILLFAHLTSLVVGFGAVMVIDSFGLLWLFKRVGLTFVIQVANVTQKLIWLGWIGLVVTGVPMLIIKGQIDNLVQIKLFLVLMLGLNGIFLHFIKRGSEKLDSNGTVPLTLQLKMGLATAISQTGWWGATVIGFTHRQISHQIDWPKNPWLIIIILFGIFLLPGILGRKIFPSYKSP